MHALGHTSLRNTFYRIASFLALMGGLIQIFVSVSILFFPVLVQCQVANNNRVCQGHSYIELGGNALGYTFLILMIVMGLIASASSRDSSSYRAFWSRWLAVLASIVVVVVAGFGFGLMFAPGALLLLAAALLTWPRPDLSA
jgi:hypothetical protein